MNKPLKDCWEIDYPAKKNLEVETANDDEMIHPFQNREKAQVKEPLDIGMSSAIDDHET